MLYQNIKKKYLTNIIAGLEPDDCADLKFISQWRRENYVLS